MEKGEGPVSFRNLAPVSMNMLQWMAIHLCTKGQHWVNYEREHGVGRECGVKSVQEELNGGEGLIQSNAKNDYTHTHTRNRDASVMIGPRKANIKGCCR